MKNSNQQITTTKINAGIYHTTDGKYRIERTHKDENGENDGDGWNLFSIVSEEEWGDGYCNTFCTKWEALRAVNEIEADARAEQDFERRAAFGSGVDVVNILTGERFRT
jgi:hypothetical protein